jgi:hypothetical protein
MLIIAGIVVAYFLVAEVCKHIFFRLYRM